MYTVVVLHHGNDYSVKNAKKLDLKQKVIIASRAMYSLDPH